LAAASCYHQRNRCRHRLPRARAIDERACHRAIAAAGDPGFPVNPAPPARPSPAPPAATIRVRRTNRHGGKYRDDREHAKDRACRLKGGRHQHPRSEDKQQHNEPHPRTPMIYGCIRFRRQVKANGCFGGTDNSWAPFQVDGHMGPFRTSRRQFRIIVARQARSVGRARRATMIPRVVSMEICRSDAGRRRQAAIYRAPPEPTARPSNARGWREMRAARLHARAWPARHPPCGQHHGLGVVQGSGFGVYGLKGHPAWIDNAGGRQKFRNPHPGPLPRSSGEATGRSRTGNRRP
jgi:hypothetical protein